MILQCAFTGIVAAQAKTATSTTLVVTTDGNVVTSISAGGTLRLTAHVSAGGAAVTPGQMDFCDASATSCADIHLLGTAQLTAAGTATLNLRPGIGNHSYKASFRGTKTYASSVSGVSTITATGTITPLATSTVVNQTGIWGDFTLSATVAETGNTASPAGVVSFLDANHGNAVLATGALGSPFRGAVWSNVKTSAPNLAGVSTAVADLNGDGVPDLFFKDYFGTYDVLLGKGDGTFSIGASAFGPQSQIGSFAVGDFNNDGIPDVAAINAIEGAPNNTITILLGKGDGSFNVAMVSPAIGLNPAGIAVADLNEDGNADLAISQVDSSEQSQLLVFFGNGDGTFTQNSSSTAVSSTSAVITTADVNNDGNVDLVLSGGATILLGSGDGAFSVVAGPMQSGGVAVAVADVNNDGLPDLMLAEGNTSLLDIFLGHGDGTFTAAPAGPTANLQVENLAIGDINQDGIPDIVYAIPGATGVGLLLGEGDGSFNQTSTTATYAYDFDGDFVIADFNGDGWPDVLALDASNRVVEDSLTQPTETTTASTTISIASPGLHLVEASYPGDSNFGGSNSGTIPLWGQPPATATTLSVTSGATAVSSVPAGSMVALTATVDAAGIPVTAGQVNFCDASAVSCSDVHLLGSVALSSSGTAALRFVPGPGTHSYKAVFVEDGYGLPSSSATISLSVGPAPSVTYTDAAAIVFNGSSGDYSLTASVVGYGGAAVPTGVISFLDTSFGNASLGTATLGGSTAGLGWLVSQTPATGAHPAAEATGDFNQDGIPDIAVLWTSGLNGGSSVTILSGKGDGTFSASAPITVGTGEQSGSYMISGDFNGDGQADLAVLSSSIASNTSYVTTLLCNGDGTFGSPRTSVAFDQGQVGGDFVQGSMVASDLNGDGKLDIAIAGDYVTAGGVSVLLGQGDGTFAAGSAFAPANDFGLIAAGDFNGDGVPDLVATNYLENGTSPTVFLGKGDGTFTATSTSFTLDYFPASIVVGDFDGDGNLDLGFSDLLGVEIALGDGKGTFKETAASPIAIPSELSGLIVGDFNHDGKPDIAGFDSDNDQVVLLLGGGDGSFTVTATTPVLNQDTSGSASSMASADFNEDGVPDLVVLTQNQTTASILLAEPTQTVTATLSSVAPVGAGTHNVKASYPGDHNYPSADSSPVALTAGLAPLTITPAGGTFSSTQTVTITEAIPGATIYYQAFGASNSNGYIQYTGPIALSVGGSETITAYATEAGYDQSSYTTVAFSLNLPIAPTPVISPSGGLFAGPQAVTITDTAPGTPIYYTTDGTSPSTSSMLYSGPVNIAASTTIAAIAAGSGYSASSPATAQFFIQSSQSRYIYTVAGSGNWGFGGDGGPAAAAILNAPTGAAVDAAGNLYIADSGNRVVRKVDAATGIISTIAGTGVNGYSGDGGLATKAQLGFPDALAFDAHGNLYIADSGDYVVRRVDGASGTISTVAGTGKEGASGDGGPATEAMLRYPQGIAFDSAGNFYIGDDLEVRRINANTGVITTVAGGGNAGLPGDGGPATSASLGEVASVAIDKPGNLYIADRENNVIRKVTAATGIITTVAGQEGSGNSGYSGDGGPATSAKLENPMGVVFDSAGNLYIIDGNNSLLREVTAADGKINTIAGHPGDCTTLSGDGGPAEESGLCYAPGVAVDGQDNLYITEQGYNRVRKLAPISGPPTKNTAQPVFSVAAGNYAAAQTLTITDATPGAEIYVSINGDQVRSVGQGYSGPIGITGSATIQALAVAPGYLPSAPMSATYTMTTPPPAIIHTFAGSGTKSAVGIGGPAIEAGTSYPMGIAFDATNNLYIADVNNRIIWEVSAKTGKANVIAGIPGVVDYPRPPGPATDTALSSPQQVAVDASGNVYIADVGMSEVQRVDAKSGMMTVFAGGGYPTQPSIGDGGPATQATISPSGLAIDQAGDLYISDDFHDRVRKVSLSSGIITSVAGGGSSGSGDGGLATSAVLYDPGPIVFDSKGNLFISEQIGRVRMVDGQTGIITTFAGNGNSGATGDGGPAIAAEVYASALAVDSSDNLYLANTVDGIRMVPAGGGTISRVVGVGYTGFEGDGGAATMAEFCGPEGLAFDKVGSLYIADSCNSRVRQVTYSKPAASPTFSPAAGSYQGTQTVTITDTTQGAVIYYTTDGSAPTTGSIVYDAPLTVSSSQTLNAIAAATGYTVSAVSSVNYVIMQQAVPEVSTITSSLNPSMAGDPVTLMVGVSSSAGSPSGKVTFMDGTVELGSATLANGSAIYTTSPLGAGSHSITASYSGDTNFTSATSGVLTQIVENFSIATSNNTSSTATASSGGQASYTLVVTPPAAGNALTFSVTGLPAGATGTFSPSTISAGASAMKVTLTVTLPGNAAMRPVEEPFEPWHGSFALALVLVPFARKRLKGCWICLSPLFVIATGLILGFGIAACGGSGKPIPPAQQTYTLTVTATSGSLTQSTQLTLLVQ